MHVYIYFCLMKEMRIFIKKQNKALSNVLHRNQTHIIIFYYLYILHYDVKRCIFVFKCFDSWLLIYTCFA